VPAATPVTTPLEEIVATPVVVLLHVPLVLPVIASVMLLAAHTVPGPVIAPSMGSVSIVTILVATAVPHILVTE